jgi:hypothetical protein
LLFSYFGWFAFVEIVRVQQMMCCFAHGFTQKLFVQFYDVRVFVRFADGFHSIFVVYCHSVASLTPMNRYGGEGLSASTNATARTSSLFRWHENAIYRS